MQKYKVQVLKKVVFWYWRIVSTKNGQVVTTSETYFSKDSALRTAEKVAEIFKLKMEIK